MTANCSVYEGAPTRFNPGSASSSISQFSDTLPARPPRKGYESSAHSVRPELNFLKLSARDRLPAPVSHVSAAGAACWRPVALVAGGGRSWPGPPLAPLLGRPQKCGQRSEHGVVTPSLLLSLCRHTADHGKNIWSGQKKYLGSDSTTGETLTTSGETNTSYNITNICATTVYRVKNQSN